MNGKHSTKQAYTVAVTRGNVFRPLVRRLHRISALIGVCSFGSRGSLAHTQLALSLMVHIDIHTAVHVYLCQLQTTLFHETNPLIYSYESYCAGIS